MSAGQRLAIVLVSTTALCCLLAPAAVGKGLMNGSPAPAGVALDGSPYRFLTISPAVPKPLTVVERVDRRGGRVSRWWYLPGRFSVIAPAYDFVGAGLSADERVLVLSRLHQSVPVRRTRLAILDTRTNLRHPGQNRKQAISYVGLKGDYGIHAISPDGTTVYLTHLLKGPTDPIRFTIRALDTAGGRLLPQFSIPGNGEILTGLPVTREPDASGRTVYTLYYDFESRRISILVLDTVAPSLRRVELPQLRGRADPMLLRLRLSESGHRLAVSTRSRNGHDKSPRPLLRINTRTFAVRRVPPRAHILAWASTSRRLPGIPLTRRDLVGHSAGGSDIWLKQLGDPTLDGRLLVFGCVHGDECAARAIEPLASGCPDPHSNVFVVPNLDPDGSAIGTRLNGRGVDLNRNFPVAWRPIGERGDPEYAGPRPFSEPETRLAARIVRALDPRATIWFHQHHGAGAYVRAWGQSAPAGRKFASWADIRFRLMPWLAGTAPNWQNNRFPGTSSFVVELPFGGLDPGLENRLGKAILRLARQVGKD